MTQFEFAHRVKPATENRTPLLLLHGTGGNDLLPLGRNNLPL